MERLWRRSSPSRSRTSTCCRQLAASTSRWEREADVRHAARTDGDVVRQKPSRRASSDHLFVGAVNTVPHRDRIVSLGERPGGVWRLPRGGEHLVYAWHLLRAPLTEFEPKRAEATPVALYEHRDPLTFDLDSKGFFDHVRIDQFTKPPVELWLRVGARGLHARSRHVRPRLIRRRDSGRAPTHRRGLGMPATTCRRE